MKMPKIETIYAFISTEEGPEDEGVVAVKVGDVWMPLVGADMKRVESLRPLAKEIAQTTGKRIVLAKFTVREDMEI
jgi:hypothetical protein